MLPLSHLCNMQEQAFRHIHFLGVAGAGMSALAQYLVGQGFNVSGSDRLFNSSEQNDTRDKLERKGVACFPQDGSGLPHAVDLVVISTAVEETVPELVQARSLQIPVWHRSRLLAWLVKQRKTIAIAGTSGKSTVAAMVYCILEYAKLQPSLITGAGLVTLIENGEVGNAMSGQGDWLVIEADESDGSITEYEPEIGVVLNIDKDHKEIIELIALFKHFKENCRLACIVNQSQALTSALSSEPSIDFSSQGEMAGTMAIDFIQINWTVECTIDGINFSVPGLGRHTVSNVAAAVAASKMAGVSVKVASEALRNYKGIYRRHQLYGIKNNVILIDDYAHNPAKCAASILAVQPLASRVVAWFQPHGFGPTSFLKNEFIKEISEVLRDEDEICMSEIYYAGGTTVKTISAEELIMGIKRNNKTAHYISNRNDLIAHIKTFQSEPVVLLLMGARDPSLEDFAKQIWSLL